MIVYKKGNLFPERLLCPLKVAVAIFAHMGSGNAHVISAAVASFKCPAAGAAGGGFRRAGSSAAGAANQRKGQQ